MSGLTFSRDGQFDTLRSVGKAINHNLTNLLPLDRCLLKHYNRRCGVAAGAVPHGWGAVLSILDFGSLCYTHNMQGDRSLWPNWAHRLHHWGLGEVVAYTLDAAGPLAVFGAQFLYLGQPFLHGVIPDSHLTALAGLLEDASQRQDFAEFLRREEHP